MLFHRCGPYGSVHAAAEGNAGGGRPARGNRPYTVDLHCHVMTPGIEKLVAARPEKASEMAQLARGMGTESVDHNNKVMLPAAGPKLTNLELRLQDMDAMGVDLQVISPSPTQYYYWADADLAAVLVREQNEAIAVLCRKHPDRLAGLGNVALQHADLAVRQLEHAVRDLGLKGVEISTAINGLDVANPAFARFWDKAGELGCVVLIHPFGTSLGDRLDRYYLGNIIGQPLETTIALSDLIFSGTLDRCEKVKIVAAHGGGYLPTYIGRSDHGHAVRPEARRCRHAPHEYLKRIWFDSIVYDPMALRQLIDRVGVSQVVVGTDYPFDMGHYSPHELVDAVAGLTPADREAIFSGNALALIGETRRSRQAARSC
jgi:aminocarboxymuconate-semialdehyde decarboxylase